MIYIIFLCIVIGFFCYITLHKRWIRLNCVNHLEQMLLDTTNLLEKHAINYWLDYGTLLGAYRSKSMSLHEFDVDLSIEASDIAKLIEFMKNLQPGYYLNNPPRGDLSKWVKNKIKIRHKKMWGSIDIYIYYPFHNQTLCQSKACVLENEIILDCKPNKEFLQLNYDVTFPLKTTQMTVAGQSKTYNIPNQTLKYLNMLYGTNLTPDFYGILGNRFFIKKLFRKTRG